jgi:hypothetical protein
MTLGTVRDVAYDDRAAAELGEGFALPRPVA